MVESQLQSQSSSIRVLLADENLTFRQRVKSVLQQESDILLVGECSAGFDVLLMCEAFNPHIALVDLCLSDMDGVEVTYQLTRLVPQTKVLILSDLVDPHTLESIRHGASGYLLKNVETHQLIQAMRIIASGGYYIHPVMMGQLVNELRRLSWKEGVFGRICTTHLKISWQEILTYREMEVLRLMTQGKNNRLIGRHLSISEKTVKNHVSSILYKMSVRDRTQAVLLAIQYGWIEII